MATKKKGKNYYKLNSCVKTMLHKGIMNLSIDSSCLVLDLSEGRGDSDVNKSNKSFVIWPEVKINRVFFSLEIFGFIKL